LATRCSRMSRDCYDPVLAKELEIISCELVEKAVNLEILFTLPRDSVETEDPGGKPDSV
jgi:hypothetical protein